jgi:YNFM family putative membrane transporter
VTACQLGVASSTEHNRGFATAVYFSAYYVAGAIGGYVPGLAWQSWGWHGVAGLATGVLIAGFAVLAATAGWAPQRSARASRAAVSNDVSSSGISS